MGFGKSYTTLWLPSPCLYTMHCVCFSHQSRGRLADLVAEHLDHLHYLNDILCININALNEVLTDQLLNRLLIPLYVYSLTMRKRATIDRAVSILWYSYSQYKYLMWGIVQLFTEEWVNIKFLCFNTWNFNDRNTVWDWPGQKKDNSYNFDYELHFGVISLYLQRLEKV